MSYLPSYPYRGLKSFRYIDRDIFAGRGEDVEKIYSLLLQFRGIMIFGQSGVGKSSLISANLLPELYDNAFAPEIIRINPDEKGTFVVSRIRMSEEKNVFFPSLFDEFIDPATPKKINISFSDFEKKLTSLHIKPEKRADKRAAWQDRSEKMPVLIFDQFEEFVTLFEEDTENCDKEKNEALLQLQDKIAALLKWCYFTEDLFVKIMFVFREDYLAKFGKIFNAIPDLRDHYLRIKALKTEQLAVVIERPFDTEAKREHFAPPFSKNLMVLLEQKLAEHFKDGKLVLTEVQIVCLQLFQMSSNATTDEERIKYLEAQTINGILENFYITLLKKLGVTEYAITIDILSLLVLNEKTRNVLHEDAILDILTKYYTREQLTETLKKLEKNISIIRVEERQGGTYYEIVSEAIIPFINKKKIEKEREKIIRKRQRRTYSLISVAAVLLFGVLLILGYKAREQQKREQIKIAESQWYQKLPDDAVREGAIDLLVSKDTASEEYKKYRTLLAMLAGSYYYSMLNKNNEALAISYFAKKGIKQKDKEVLDAINVRTNEFILPKSVFSGFKDKKIVDVFNGYNGVCFLILSDNSIHSLVYDKDSLVEKDSIVDFKNQTPPFTTGFLRTSPNEVRFSSQTRISMSMCDDAHRPVYIIYSNVGARFYDEKLKVMYEIKPVKKNILAVLPYGKAGFLIMHDDGQYEKYTVSQNRVVAIGNAEKLKFGEKDLTNVYRLERFANKDYFSIAQSNTMGELIWYKCKIEKDGSINTSSVGANTKVLSLNKNSVQLLWQTSGYLLKNERTISSAISPEDYTWLLNDTNLITTYRYNKLEIGKIDTVNNKISVVTQSKIKPVPENVFPYVYSRKNTIVIKFDDTYLLYDLKEKKKKMMALIGSKDDNDFLAESKGHFMNDSMFAIVKKSAVLLYNVNDLNRTLTVTPAQDSALISLACKTLMSNDDIDQHVVETLFPKEYLRGSLNNAIANKNYPLAISLSTKLLSTSKAHVDTIDAYSGLYIAYNNMLTDLPSDTASIRKQIAYCEQAIFYANELTKIKKDSFYFSWALKRMGGLSWYQILNGQSDSALNTIQAIIEKDKKNEQQWVNTNLALAYLFTGQTDQAIKVYQKWKDKYFNDDTEKASVRFLEDINVLQKDYGINIPKKDTILRILRTP